MNSYYSASLVATDDWQYQDVVADLDNPLHSVAIINDGSNPMSVKINGEDNDEIEVGVSETISLNIMVVRIWFYSESGSNEFRVLCDG